MPLAGSLKTTEPSRLLCVDFVEKRCDSASTASVEAFSETLRLRVLRLNGREPAIAGGSCRHFKHLRSQPGEPSQFCAVAASRNSSLASHEPRSRKRPSRNTRLRWATNISIFFHRRQAVSYSRVPTSARATSWESSSMSRGIFRATAFGQHLALSSQTSQSFLLAR
jgi:hypothetical protein